MSVYVAAVLSQTGRSEASVRQQYPDYGIAAFPAGFARGFKQSVCFSPTLSGGKVDFAHGHVVGKKPDSVAKKFANSKEVTLIVYPAGFVRPGAG